MSSHLPYLKVSGLIIAPASAFNVVLNVGTVEAVVVAVLPVLLSLLARAKVTPV